MGSHKRTALAPNGPPTLDGCRDSSQFGHAPPTDQARPLWGRRQADAQQVWQLDDRGDLVKGAYFGVDGKPSVDNSGVAGSKAEFDARGNGVKAVKLGLEGQLTLNDSAVAGQTERHDARGKRIKSTHS